MATPLTFSVGIPTFNQADYLEETILSLINQTRPPDEILISDHHSTDDTPEIIAKYARHVRVVQPPPGANLAAQYNFTLTSQTCDWITLLSSDDLARSNFCEVLTRGATRHRDAVLVRSGWEHIDGQAKVTARNYLLSVPRVEAPPATLISQKHGPRVNFAAFAIRRDAWLKSGPILESLESLADWALFLQIAPFGAFIYEHALISGYRVGHDGNKFRDRLGPWVRDQQRIFEHVMPLAAQRARITDTAFIAEASRYNLLRYLSRAGDEFPPAERAPIVPLFQPWAAAFPSPATDKALAAFARGESVTTPIPLTTRLRTKLRPILHGLYGALRRH